MKRLKRILLAIFVLLLLYLLAWPVSVEPVAWEPPAPPPLEGVYAANHALSALERVGEGVGHGPEDVAVDGEGRLYAGMEDGRVVRMAADGTGAETLAHTGGRPLGLDFAPDGTLIVADAIKGLLSVSAAGAVELLSSAAAGLPYGFTDDVDVGPDGTIYFSDASSKFGIHEYFSDIIEHGGHGRLLAQAPDGEVRVLMDGLQFANGVAVSPDGAFVLIAETGAYRIRRYWLSGPRAGNHDVFIDNLPGFPDGISCNGVDTFWVAFFAPRNPAAESLAPYPSLRKIIMRLPAALRPKPVRRGLVLGLDVDGRVVHNLQDPDGGFAPITSVEEVGGVLYMGSLKESAIGRLAAP